MRTRIEFFDRDLLFAPGSGMSPEENRQAFVAFVSQGIADAVAQNHETLGRYTPYENTVDGSAGKSLDQVKPEGGVVVTDFDVGTDAVVWCLEKVKENSPVRTGRFRDSNQLLADGVPVTDLEQLPPADEYVIVSTVPYARKLEGSGNRKPLSPMAPKGVYQVTAAMAQARYGNVARIRFGFVSVLSAAIKAAAKQRGERKTVTDRNSRQPAIIISFK